jgi:hypothetical protein
MATGIDLARVDAPEHAAVIEHFKEQLLIVFLKRLGGKVSIPVAEADDTGGDMLAFNIVDGVFNFEIKRKS